MKKIFLTLSFIYSSLCSFSQNTFPATGNVGIGTLSPIGILDVRGDIFGGTSDLILGATGSFVQINQGNSTGNTYTQIRAYSNGGNVANNLILQNSGGNVGIGITVTD